MGHCQTTPQWPGQYCKRSSCSQLPRWIISSCAQRDSPSFIACQGSGGAWTTGGAGRGIGTGSGVGGGGSAGAGGGNSTLAATFRRAALGGVTSLSAGPV